MSFSELYQVVNLIKTKDVLEKLKSKTLRYDEDEEH